jgi:hypothetical protein
VAVNRGVPLVHHHPRVVILAQLHAHTSGWQWVPATR